MSCRCLENGYSVACRRHWNETGIRAEIDRAISWGRSGPLRANDPSDRRVLQFFDELAYWAARGIGEAGSVGSIYSAIRERG